MTLQEIDFAAIPKVENHLHLEGAIPIDTIWQLIQKYGGDPSASNLDQLNDRFRYKNFNQFIETWSWKNQFIREYDDFTLLTGSVLEDLIIQNVKYAEIFISPSLFKNTVEIQRIVETISNEIKRHVSIKVNLIVDLVRDFGPENEMKTLHEINEVKDYGIKGIGIGGTEAKYPPGLFKDVFEKARNFGFKTTAHAGEAAGPESIWSAIHELQVDRIGHGTSAAKDLLLLDYLAKNKLPLEICILSNLRTNVISELKNHPIKTFIEMGIPVSINTDDPKMFNNSLSEEYQTLYDTFALPHDAIQDLILKSIDTMWLDKEDKEKLNWDFRNDL